jgi:AmmeMemoRadiSam system protein B
MKPKLRRFQITPVEQNGDEFLLLHDPMGIAADSGVPRELGYLLSLFDGTRTHNEIITDYKKLGGEELPSWFIEKTIADLDENYMIESPRFETKLREVEQNPVRPAVLAGLSYPEDVQQLRTQLNGFSQQARELLPASTQTTGKLRGIVVPHIDFTRGGVVEALAYEPLKAEEFDVLVVLGIAHCGVRYPFCAAPKDFETPLGTAPCDREFVAALQEHVGERLTREQIAHKNEHSIEFVTVFLQHFDQFKNTRIVPIICGGFFDEIQSGDSPSRNQDVAQFIRALREVTHEWESRGERVGFIASVDGAHVGTQFGDPRVITPSRLQQIEEGDREFWRHVADGDAEAMHAHIARDNNERNVDAHPALYTLLTAFPELRGELLHYAQAYNREQNIVVSFAAMSLYEA